MAEALLPIGNGSYLNSSLPVSAQECVNWYVSQVQAPALAEKVLFGTPGTALLVSSGSLLSDANRGAWKFNGVPYFVNGNRLCRLESDLATLTHLGTITGSGRVGMSDNGTQLCILVTGTTSTGYIFTTGPDTLVEITDLDFKANGEPTHVVFVDGYFVFPTSDKKFRISALNDGTAYGALDFGSAEADPDDIVAAVVFKNQLVIAGTRTLEFFQNIGGADFPFQRTGIFVSKGVSAHFTLINTSNSFVFVGAGENEDVAIWRWEGGDVVKMSTDAIDTILQTCTQQEIEEMFAYSYSSDGSHFVCFALPFTTLVVDESTGLWHERRSTVPGVEGMLEVRSRVNSLVVAYGETLVGDSSDGRIGMYRRSVLDEYGDNIRRSVSLQPLQNTGNAFFISALELTVESGVGNSEVVDPQITLEVSRDGGKTYSDGKARKIGKIGEYTKRVIWRRLGRIPRFAVFRFSLSEAVKPVIIQLIAELEGEE